MAEYEFSFTTEDYEAPLLRNTSPSDGEGGISLDSLISLDVVDAGVGVDRSTIAIYVNGSQVFQGPSTFIAPYNGPQSSISATSTGGYDGYNIVLDNTGNLSFATTYTVRVVAEDYENNSLDTTFSFKTHTRISSVDMGPYEITIDVNFGSQMGTGVYNAANYTFTNGMYARYAEFDGYDTVRLWVELFYGNEEFVLTVSENVKDAEGYPILAPYNSITVAPFQSTANIGSFNGKVRTWRESSLVYADSHRIYLAGSKGVDIFFKGEDYAAYRWAQIFDAYGVNAMFVAHFGGDYEFSDSGSPYLRNRNPFPGSEALPTTTIYFQLVDEITAVEVTTLTVYINEVLAFGGSYGGWQNGFSGTILIGYQYLDVNIVPPSSFTDGEEVEVRVIAQDLLGNSLDASYSFSVGAAGLGAGFGGSEFGTTSFGGV